MLIQLYVLRQLLLSVGFSAAGIGLIVLPTIAIQAINKLGAISLTVILQYLPLVVAELVPYLLPMAFLLGVVATYGRLSADRELIAIQMAGIHPARLALPGLLVAAPLALGTDYLLGEASPSWKYQQRQYVKEAAVDRFVNGMRGRNELQFGKFSLTSEESFDEVHKGVLLDLQQENGQRLTVAADEAILEVQGDVFRIQLRHATVLTESARVYDESPTYTLRLAELFPSQPFSRNQAKYLTTRELRAELARDPAEVQTAEPESQGEVSPEKQRQDFRYEIHRRHALSCTYLLFLLLGIPTGVVLRSSTQLGAFTGAVGYAFLYYVLALRLGKVLAATGAIPAVAAAWATNGLFFAMGLVFFVRALWR